MEEQKKVGRPPRQEVEKIEVTKDELKALIQDGIQSFITAQGEVDTRESNEWAEEKEGKEIKKARVKLYREDTNKPFGIIVDWKFLKNEYDENSRKYDKAMYEITVKYGDEEKKVVMPLIEFSQINDYETVDIIQTEAKEMVKVLGKVRLAMPDKSGYTRSVFAGANGAVDRPILGDFVDEKVKKIVAVHTIRRPNGEILKIPNERLNP